MPRLGCCSTLFVVAALAAVLPAPIVHAQGAVKPDKKQVAKRYVDAGLAAQDAGDHDTALTFYAKAYELVPHPVLHFNMAQVHRLAGRKVLAVEYYRKYVAADPKGSQVPVAVQHLALLEKQVAAEQAAKAAEDAKLAGQQAEEARRAEAARAAEAARVAKHAPLEEQRSAAERDRAARTAPPVEPEPARGRTLRLIGYAGGGLGVVSLGIGVAFGLKARSLSHELSEPGAPFDRRTAADGEAAERLMIASMAVGGALVIGGGICYVLGRTRPRSAEVATVAPLVLSEGAGLLVRGSF